MKEVQVAVFQLPCVFPAFSVPRLQCSPRSPPASRTEARRERGCGMRCDGGTARRGRQGYRAVGGRHDVLNDTQVLAGPSGAPVTPPLVNPPLAVVGPTPTAGLPKRCFSCTLQMITRQCFS